MSSDEGPVAMGVHTRISPLPFEQTVQHLVDSINEHGLRLFGVIDHRAAAAEAGLRLHPTKVLMVGSPEVGTPLMAEWPLVALELPARILVWQDADGTVRAGWLGVDALEEQFGLDPVKAARLSVAGTLVDLLDRPAGNQPRPSGWVARLAYLGVDLPPVPAPVAGYVAAVRSGSMVVTSGQLPFVDGSLPTVGRLGELVSIDEGYRLARTCTLNGLAAVDALVGLDAVVKIVRVVGYVASGEEFTDQARVVDGASHLLAEIFGDAGRHARSAVGVASLPLGAPVEIEIAVEVVPVRP